MSHGYINLLAANAPAYEASALIGDPAVVNTSVLPSPADGDLLDWTIPWPEWPSLSRPDGADATFWFQRRRYGLSGDGAAKAQNYAQP